MQVAQIFGFIPGYEQNIIQHVGHDADLETIVSFVEKDRYLEVHKLRSGDNEAQIAYGNSKLFMNAWAKQRGISKVLDLQELTLNFIEESRADTIYCNYSKSLTPETLKRMPAQVKHKVIWHASPLKSVDLSLYDLVISNFPNILKTYENMGFKTAYMCPAYDSEMLNYNSVNRDIDIVFFGTFSRHHVSRAKLLRALSDNFSDLSIRYYLLVSKFTKLANLLPQFSFLKNPYAIERPIRRVTYPPVYGLDIYRTIGRSKIVINGAIDMAGKDRGNMRCWEALGCGSLLVSDAGNYPEGMVPGETLLTYHNTEEAIDIIKRSLENEQNSKAIANRGQKMIALQYSKQKQWNDFQAIVNTL